MDIKEFAQELIDNVKMFVDITGVANFGDQPSNVGECTRLYECWNRLELGEFDSVLLRLEAKKDGSYLDETQQNRIDEVKSIESDYWFSLAGWAKKGNLFVRLNHKSAFNLGTMCSRN